MLPTPNEVEECLQDAGDRQRQEIARLSEGRKHAIERNTDSSSSDAISVAECNRQIAEAARLLETLDFDVLRTVLVLPSETTNTEVFAIVNHGGGRSLIVGGSAVQLVSTDTRAGQQMRGSKVGDVLSLGVVVEVDVQQTRRAHEEQIMLLAYEAQVKRERDLQIASRQQKEQAVLSLATQQAREQQEKECQEQNAFEERAAAHFDKSRQENTLKALALASLRSTKKARRQPATPSLWDEDDASN